MRQTGAAKYEKVFAEMPGNPECIEKFARENNDEILSAGALIDKNGKVSYCMVGRSKDTTENPGTVYKEKVQKKIAEKRAKRKAEEALKEKKKEDCVAAAWTLGQLEKSIGNKAASAVKAKVPGWTYGKPILPDVLDEIFADESITSMVSGKSGTAAALNGRRDSELKSFLLQEGTEVT